jgi:hypothetical protein
MLALLAPTAWMPQVRLSGVVASLAHRGRRRQGRNRGDAARTLSANAA